MVTIHTTRLNVLENNTTSISPQSACMGLDGSQKKQRLFPHSALTNWFLVPNVYYAVRAESLTINQATFTSLNIFKLSYEKYITFSLITIIPISMADRHRLMFPRLYYVFHKKKNVGRLQLLHHIYFMNYRNDL